MIKCPYCGSEEFEIFDTFGGVDGDDMTQIGACLECGKNFYIIYEFSHIEGED